MPLGWVAWETLAKAEGPQKDRRLYSFCCCVSTLVAVTLDLEGNLEVLLSPLQCFQELSYFQPLPHPGA